MFMILLTILIGLFLSLITVPLGYFSPEWLLLINIYWAIAIPGNNKLLLAFFSGILVDIMFGQIFGISSLLYVLLIYIVLTLYNSLRYMTVTQQMVVLLFFIIIKVHLFVWVNFMIGLTVEYQNLLISSFTTALMWPLTYYILRYVRRKFKLSDN